MTEKIVRKQGAPRGNQHARKHGFYSSVLDEIQQEDFIIATTIEGIDEEIALLRVKIKSLVQHDPENIKLLMHAINTLSRLVIAKYNISKDDKEGMREKIAGVLKDIALPIGVGIGTSLGK